MKHTLSTRLVAIADRLERFTEISGRAVAWLVLILVLLVGYDVGMRYLFNRGSIALQEMEWHLFSLIFLLGGAYTLLHDDHVRVDVFYQSRWMTDYRRAWVNLVGTLLFLLPFCILVIISAWPFVQAAYIHHEISPDPGGLTQRWIIKSAIPLAFALLLIQGIAMLLRNLVTVLDRPR